MAAFEEALRCGADGVEFDARLTSDGALVVMHDDDVSRTTDRPGRISAMTLSEVRALNAGARWSDTRASVPTVQEVLDLLRGRVQVVLELKGALTEDGYMPAEPVARAVAPLLQGYPNVVVSSFDPFATAAMRVLAPEIATGVTLFHGMQNQWALRTAIDVGHVECHIPQAQVDEAFVTEAHAAGRAVLCWTVNEAERLAELMAMGVDGVFTDDPGGLRAAAGLTR